MAKEGRKREGGIGPPHFRRKKRKAPGRKRLNEGGKRSLENLQEKHLNFLSFSFLLLSSPPLFRCLVRSWFWVLGFGFGGRRCSIFLKAEAVDAAREKKRRVLPSRLSGGRTGKKNQEEKTQNTLDKTRSFPHTFLNLRRHSGGIGALFCCPFSPFCSRAPKIHRALKANWREGE